MENPFWFQRAPTKRVEGGIKARVARFGESWWSARWLEILGNQSSGRLTRGRTYARKGQITDFTVRPGKISGRIQGSADDPYEVGLWMPPVTGEALRHIEQEIKSKPLFSAKLLNREMPQEIETLFAKQGKLLFPDSLELLTKCDCPDEANPCKHIAAIFYLFSLELERDPFLLLYFRGLDRQILPAQAAITPALIPVAPRPEPLPSAPREFWKQARVPQMTPTMAPAKDAVLVEQLGHFPLWRGESDFLKILQSAYAAATTKALDLLSHSKDPTDQNS